MSKAAIAKTAGGLIVGVLVALSVTYGNLLHAFCSGVVENPPAIEMPAE